VARNALQCAMLFQVVMRTMSDPRAGREKRIRELANWLLGRPKTTSLKVLYEPTALKADWDGLRAGWPRVYIRYLASGLGGIWPLKAEDDTYALNADDAVVAVQAMHGFPSWEACRRALHRAGAKGLPNTREPV